MRISDLTHLLLRIIGVAAHGELIHLPAERLLGCSLLLLITGLICQFPRAQSASLLICTLNCSQGRWRWAAGAAHTSVLVEVAELPCWSCRSRVEPSVWSAASGHLVTVIFVRGPVPHLVRPAKYK